MQASNMKHNIEQEQKHHDALGNALKQQTADGYDIRAVLLQM